MLGVRCWMLDVCCRQANLPPGKEPDGRNSKFGPHGAQDVIGFRELAGLQLGIDFLAIDEHLERASARRHQFERADALLEAQKFLRQTDGFWFVVSSRAVFDCDVGSHDSISNTERGGH